MSRRWRYPSARRGEFFQSPRSVAVQSPAFIPVLVRQAGEYRLGLRVRRGRFTERPRTMIALPPAFLPAMVRQAGELRLAVRIRRGSIRMPQQEARPPLTQHRRTTVTLPRSRSRGFTASVTEPGRVPGVTARDPARVGAARRGRFAVPPLTGQVAAPTLAPRVSKRPIRLAAIRQGHVFAPPWPLTTQTPPPFPPRAQRTQVRLMAVRRGDFACPPWSALTPPASPWIPPAVTTERRTPAIRRGRFTVCPSATPAAPPFLAATRPGLPPRRPRTIPVCPPGQARPPEPSRARRPQGRPRRRFHVEPPWPQSVPLPPPALVPAVRHGRAAPPALRVHSRIWPGWMELTVTPEPESAAGTMSARERPGAMAAGVIRTGTSMSAWPRRGAEMEGA